MRWRSCFHSRSVLLLLVRRYYQPSVCKACGKRVVELERHSPGVCCTIPHSVVREDKNGAVRPTAEHGSRTILVSA